MSLFQSHHLVANTALVRPDEGVVKVVCGVIKQLGDFAFALTNAFPGVNPTARQGFTCPRFIFDTDSWQGAEFLFATSSHAVACFHKPPCATKVAVAETLFVLLHLRQGFLVLVLGPDPLFAGGYSHSGCDDIDLHLVKLLIAEMLQVEGVEMLA